MDNVFPILPTWFVFLAIMLLLACGAVYGIEILRLRHRVGKLEVSTLGVALLQVTEDVGEAIVEPCSECRRANLFNTLEVIRHRGTTGEMPKERLAERDAEYCLKNCKSTGRVVVELVAHRDPSTP